MPRMPGSTTGEPRSATTYRSNRHFYVFEPPRPLADIDADLKRTTDRILAMFKDMAA